MGWATIHIARLEAGEVIQIRPKGGSMTGKINSGDLCTITPVNREVEKSDIVLCRVGRAQYLHLVTAVKNGRYQISNNKGHVNGWISRDNIYGICVAVEP
jgi:phage repressor protein C with HTH and peptisase S24 domain